MSLVLVRSAIPFLPHQESLRGGSTGLDTKFVTTVNLEKAWLGPQRVKQAQREVGCAVPA